MMRTDSYTLDNLMYYCSALAASPVGKAMVVLFFYAWIFSVEQGKDLRGNKHLGSFLPGDSKYYERPVSKSCLIQALKKTQDWHHGSVHEERFAFTQLICSQQVNQLRVHWCGQVSDFEEKYEGGRKYTEIVRVWLPTPNNFRGKGSMKGDTFMRDDWIWVVYS